MVAELSSINLIKPICCSLAKISMVAEPLRACLKYLTSCSLAKISMVAEQTKDTTFIIVCCSLAKISMVAERTPY